MIIIQTPRLVIRHLQPQDFDDFYAICGDAELMHYMGDGQALTKEVTQQWIDVSLRNYETVGYGCSAVLDKLTHQFIGFCGLVRSHELPGEIELIYALAKPYWGQGLATEAAQAMLRYGFETFHLPRIYATVDPDNTASVKVIEKSGFRYTETISDEAGMVADCYVIVPETEG